MRKKNNTTRKYRAVLGVLLVLAMTFSLAACGSSSKGSAISASGDSVTIDNLALRPDGEAGLLYENGGLKLMIPLEYDELLQIEMPENDENGILLSVAEKASVEVAKAQGYDSDGAGALFSIGKIDEPRMFSLIQDTDLSGTEIFAVDAYGDYYVYYHPTDVRYVREDNEAMVRDQEIWSALNEWAFGSVRKSMLQENPQLMAMQIGTTDLDLHLARIAYIPGASYTLAGLEYGAVEPKAGEFDAAPYLERLMNGVTYEYTDEEAPDGEYLVLSFPEEGTRFDFFLMEGKENYIREVHEGSDYAEVYLATFDDAETRATDVVKEWYYAAVGATPAGVVENAAGAAEPILGILGGWKATDSPRMSDEATAAFEKAMEGFTGVGYEPLACLATQQVSGTNYAVFCRAQVVYPDAKPYYAVVYVYEDLQGNAELLKIVSLTPNGEADPNAGAGGTLLGGWTVAEEQEPGLEAFDQAAQKLLGVSYTPIYVLSSQVVSGTNYCVLSKAEVVAPGAEGYYTLATVYQDLSGNVEITEFRNLEIGELYEAAYE